MLNMLEISPSCPEREKYQIAYIPTFSILLLKHKCMLHVLIINNGTLVSTIPNKLKRTEQ